MDTLDLLTKLSPYTKEILNELINSSDLKIGVINGTYHVILKYIYMMFEESNIKPQSNLSKNELKIIKNTIRESYKKLFQSGKIIKGAVYNINKYLVILIYGIKYMNSIQLEMAQVHSFFRLETYYNK